ncbi:uncharacterized protein BDZ99DRAFT_497580 [Mytilinidion resinicola]|uniref:Uncharacterized protein n=1 Tax=Mytilinidion resinicola TaxID=574789 RepID=A0A6A6YSQ6_9PEZI|nr:uncharacterized protein BDZ99DRAFT_497580 [Mytilinidion resinicola]KAF2811976.1 hypothetical protein BDZ99DRAFT_497580 [Mytilinidion resinicola]
MNGRGIPKQYMILAQRIYRHHGVTPHQHHHRLTTPGSPAKLTIPEARAPAGLKSEGCSVSSVLIKCPLLRLVSWIRIEPHAVPQDPPKTQTTGKAALPCEASSSSLRLNRTTQRPLRPGVKSGDTRRKFPSQPQLRPSRWWRTLGAGDVRSNPVLLVEGVPASNRIVLYSVVPPHGVLGVVAASGHCPVSGRYMIAQWRITAPGIAALELNAGRQDILLGPKRQEQTTFDSDISRDCDTELHGHTTDYHHARVLRRGQSGKCVLRALNGLSKVFP